MRRPALLCALFAILSCAPDTPEGSRPVTVEVLDRSEPRSTGLADTARLGTDRGRLRVRGTITVPTPCHTELRASAENSGDTLRLRIAAREAGRMCAAVLSAFDYRAATDAPLPVGTWHVEIWHAAGNRKERASAGTVSVP